MKTKTALSLGLAGVLGAFSLFVGLDTFVLSRSYRDAGEENTALFSQAPAQSAAQAVTLSGSVSAAAPVVTPTSYRDENLSVTLTEYEVNGTKVYAADVVVSSPEYLKTALAGDSYGRNITAKTSDIAAAHDAVLAINGDYYGVRERGYVIRNGVLYRAGADSGEVCCLYADGSMSVISAGEVSAQTLAENGAWQVWSFGPGLVVNGEVSVSAGEEVGRSMASNPRTAIGMIEPGHYVFVVSDGRTAESRGLSLRELAEFMESLGCETAYNLDGGGSSTMVFLGRVVNNPTTNGKTIKEREVSDIVYVA